MIRISTKNPKVVVYLAMVSAFIFSLSLGLAFQARASVMSCQSFYDLDEHQVEMIKKSYQYGLQDDLGYTLAAISWRESSLGKYRIAPESGDYGAYGINYKTVQRIDKINYYQTIDILEQIVFNDEKGAQYALKTLRWNLKYFKGDWKKAIAMYNKGSNWRHADKYVIDIIYKVRTLQTCSPKL